MIPKDEKGGFIDVIQKQKKDIPAPNKYNPQKKYKLLGNYKLTNSKTTIIDSIAFEKAFVPPPNKYNYKDLA